MKQTDYIGRRLRPSRSMPEFYTLRHLLRKVTEMVSVLKRSGWTPPIRVLDAGAACAPYRDLFSAERFQYVTVDVERFDGISSVAQGEQMPFGNGTFDLVLSNQVLEHVANPQKVCQELKRLVSERGYLLVSCPFVWEVHNFPSDYWRFSSQALRLLFEDMDPVYLEPSTNTAQCLAQTFNLFVDRNFRNQFAKAALFRLTNSPLLLAALPRRDTLLPANYVVVTRRKLLQQDEHSPPGATPHVVTNGVAANGKLSMASIPGQYRLHVDTPTSDVPVRGPVVRVSGWIAGDCAIDQVWARIDGSREWPLQCNLPRVDVWRALPQFRNAHRSGFAGECAVGLMTAGEHRLEIMGKAQGRTLTWEPVRFKATG